MGDLRINIEKALANTEIKIPIIDCLSTPVTVYSNEDSFIDSENTANSKFISDYYDSYTSIDEVRLNHLTIRGRTVF